MQSITKMRQAGTFPSKWVPVKFADTTRSLHQHKGASTGQHCKLEKGVLRRSTPGRPFSDFLETEPVSPPSTDSSKSAEEKAQELIERTAAVLQRTQEALEEVRKREPSDPRHRQSGVGITAGPTVTSTSADKDSLLSKKSILASSTSSRPTLTSLPLAWESDNDDDDDEDVGAVLSGGGSGDSKGKGKGKTSKASTKPSSSSSKSNNFSTTEEDGVSGGGGISEWSPGGLDTWFGGKVDTGPMELRPSAMTPTSSKTKSSASAIGVAVMDRPNVPSSMEFAAPENPSESGASTIFPESLMLKFQSEEQQVVGEEATKQQQLSSAGAAAAAAAGADWERTSGEEFGENGYWYRWTEVKGRDATGAVQWSERWWEVSDWKGMKEMGAEKWGSNNRGDAWRETWRESIGFDAATGQPMVERTAHKWARAGSMQEWEEKWGESYLSGGQADKYADKWARQGDDIWHERWGEQYDGEGGCVKYTDRWAERYPAYDSGGTKDKWGDKWEERFKDGRGSKTGETWSESAAGEKYQRWWGENHHGNGSVQKYGHSSTGEEWDVTEQMDTYYNPIPHFGYDLALAHSPQLRGVPKLPRDTQLGGSGSDGGGKVPDGGAGGIFG